MALEDLEAVITGVWSADYCLEPGVSDERVLAFLPSGLGMYEIHDHLGLTNCHFFSWQISPSGGLEITGMEELYLAKEAASVEKRASDLQLMTPRIIIRGEQTPISGFVQVLHVVLSVADTTRFGKFPQHIARYRPAPFLLACGKFQEPKHSNSLL